MNIKFNPSVTNQGNSINGSSITFGATMLRMYGLKSKFIPVIKLIEKEFPPSVEKQLCLDQAELFEKGKWHYSKDKRPLGAENDMEKCINMFKNDEGDVFYYIKPRMNSVNEQEHEPEFLISVGADLDDAKEVIACRPEIELIKGAWEKLEKAINNAIPKT